MKKMTSKVSAAIATVILTLLVSAVGVAANAPPGTQLSSEERLLILHFLEAELAAQNLIMFRDVHIEHMVRHEGCGNIVVVLASDQIISLPLFSPDAASLYVDDAVFYTGRETFSRANRNQDIRGRRIYAGSPDENWIQIDVWFENAALLRALNR